jgi:hypothetical protein
LAGAKIKIPTVIEPAKAEGGSIDGCLDRFVDYCLVSPGHGLGNAVPDPPNQPQDG